jgi:DNA replication and repair protein RecF
VGILARLSLRDFRNYERLDIEFEPGINVLAGANGQGKSNLLEAVYFLSVLRSFRCQQLSNLYRWGQSSFVIRGILKPENGPEFSVAVQYDRTRQLRIANEPVARASEFIGHLFTVAFAPEDIELLKGAAGVRRRFLDVMLCQLYPSYLAMLQDYVKAHKCRNTLLRAATLDTGALQAFDRIMADRGAHIIDHRRRFFSELAGHQKTITENYIGGWLLQVHYRSSVGSDELATTESLRDALLEGLTASLPRDRQRCQTHIGPHRDDYSFELDNRSLHLYGSEGQCRTAALIYKLATAQLLCASKGPESVILLVDDVIGELDQQHRDAFFSVLQQGAQTLFACTDPDLAANFDNAKCFSVSTGSVQVI